MTVLLKQFQYKVYEKIYPLVCNKKQRLAAVSVPLDRSLWPPEFCKNAVAEECRLNLFLKTKDSGDGESNDGGGGNVSQTDEEAISPSSIVEGEENAFKEKCENTVQNPDVSKSESTEAGQADNKSSVHHGKETAVGDIWKEQSQCNERHLENNDSKEIADPSLPRDTGTRNSSDLPTSDSNKNLGSKAENKNDGHLSDSVEDSLKPETDSSGENSNRKLDGAADCGLESSSEETEVTNEVTENDAEHGDAGAKDPEDSNDPSQDAGNEEGGPSDIDSAVQLIVKATKDTKDDLSKAMEKGENLQAQLRTEQAKASRILHQITHDYESYNAENMDDLFDDEDEEAETTSDTKDKIEAEDTECDLPESDQPTSLSASLHSSYTGSDSLLSHSSSGQDFPSLPSVSEGQAEIERLSKEAYQRHVKNISADVHMYLEKLLILFTIAYEQLDSPLGRDQCYASLEETFFKPLWKFLLMLFR